MRKKSGLGKLLAGIGIGASLGILFAPKAGELTRADLKKKTDDLLEKIKGLDKVEVKEYITNKVEEIRTELSELDKEKVLKIAKKKAKQIEIKTEELINYTIEKGTPVLEKSADAVREKTIEVTKMVLDKLEQKEKGKE